VQAPQWQPGETSGADPQVLRHADEIYDWARRCGIGAGVSTATA
jgi:hypothetical protein